MSNAENGGFIYSRYTPLNISATNAKTGYEIGYAFDKMSSTVFETTTNTTKVKMTFAAAVNFTGFALVNHNLTTAAIIKLQYYTDAAFTTLAVERIIPATLKNTWSAVSVPTSYMYIQIYIINTGASSISIGEIYPGILFQFPNNYSWGYKEVFKVQKDVITTDDGVHVEIPGEDESTSIEYRKFNMSFNNADTGSAKMFYPLIRPGNKIYIPNFTDSGCAYGVVPNEELVTTKEKSGEMYTLDFYEHATGEKQ